MGRKERRLAAAVLVCAATVCAAALGAEATVAAAALPVGEIQWVLDAGHGGEDGGAVSPSGVVESQINLEITRRLDSVLGFCGEAAIMLRDEDTSLHDPGAVTLREKKASDLHNRASAVQAFPEATLISIHQNSFPQAQYRGTQVFYAPTEGSQALAQAIQVAVQAKLQQENTRESKPIPETVYLLNHIPNRAVLVECGFLSNPEDEAALQERGYQLQMALLLAECCLQDTA